MALLGTSMANSVTFSKMEKEKLAKEEEDEENAAAKPEAAADAMEVEDVASLKKTQVCVSISISQEEGSEK